MSHYEQSHAETLPIKDRIIFGTMSVAAASYSGAMFGWEAATIEKDVTEGLAHAPVLVTIGALTARSAIALWQLASEGMRRRENT